LASPATRSLALETKATNLPSALMAGDRLGPLESPPPVSRLTRVVVLATMSRTKMSWVALPSPLTRSEAADWKAMNRPLPLTAGLTLESLPPDPVLSTLTSVLAVAAPAVAGASACAAMPNALAAAIAPARLTCFIVGPSSMRCSEFRPSDPQSP
jgi:hypothetical protein